MAFKLSKPPLNIEVTDFGWLKWFNDVYNIAKSFAVDIISGAVTIASNLFVNGNFSAGNIFFVTTPDTVEVGSGSADFYIDTTNHSVAVGSSSVLSGTKLNVDDDSGSGTEIQVNIRSSSDSPYGLVIGKNKATAVADNVFFGPDYAYIANIKNAPLILGTNAIERLRLRGDGRLYCSPDSQVYSVGMSYNITRQHAGQSFYIGATDASVPDMVFSEAGGAERARLTSHGDFGLGVTPNTSNLGQVFQNADLWIMGRPTLAFSYITNNAAFNSGWKYIHSFGGAVIEFNDAGGTSIYTIPAGTAGAAATLTQRFLLDVNGNLGINLQGNTPNYTLDVNGNIATRFAGSGFRIAEGSNARMGVATLVSGTKVVSNTSITANTRIFLTCNTPGGTVGFLRVSARTAATSFTILSSSLTDTSVVAWLLLEPA